MKTDLTENRIKAFLEDYEVISDLATRYANKFPPKGNRLVNTKTGIGSEPYWHESWNWSCSSVEFDSSGFKATYSRYMTGGEYENEHTYFYLERFLDFCTDPGVME